MKKLFKKSIYYLFTVIFLIPFLISALFAFLAVILNDAWSNLHDWSHI